MRKLKTRALSILLAAVMVVTMLPAVSLTAFAAGEGVPLSADNFPDASFRSDISSRYDKNSDGYLSPDEILDITYIMGNGWDVTGIRYFTALKSFSCVNSEGEISDIFNNKSVEDINLERFTRPIALDLRENKNLKSLNCYQSKITRIDVSGLTKLENINSDWAENLKSINASGCSALTKLESYNSGLTILNLTGCTALKTLDCYSSYLRTLDVSDCAPLTYLNCINNQLTSLNVAGCAALETLGCSNNQLTSLDNVRDLKALKKLYSSDNLITKLDLSGCSALSDLEISTTLTDLDISGCSALKSFYFYSHNLKTLDAKDCTSLTKLNCSQNKLEQLNVSGCTALFELYCNNNNLTVLDVTGCTELAKLNCSQNKLTALDVSQNEYLSSLVCENNSLRTLDVTEHVFLDTLKCGNNCLKTLDLTYPVVTLSCNTQTPKAAVKSVGDKWTVDFRALVGTQNLEKISMNNTLWQYDSKTGLAVYSGAGIPLELKYKHYGDNISAGMEVTLQLSQWVVVNEENFPDSVFRDYVSEEIDLDKDGYLSDDEIAAITELNLSGKEITDLTGVERFTALNALDCSNNHSAFLDLSRPIENINVSGQSAALDAQYVDGKWTVDIAELVGFGNRKRVVLAEGQNWQYDPETGLAVYLGSGEPTRLKYIYNGTNLPEGSMDVTLTAEVVGKTDKLVIMKKEQINAYVDGQILPMTDYGNGNFAMAKSMNGTYALPLRCIGEAFDMRVDYLGSGRTKLTNKAGDYVVVTRDSNILEKYDVNNNLINSFTADFATFTEASITYVPMRAVSEALGLGVSYIGSGTTGHGSYVAISTDITLNLKQDYVLAEIAKAYALGL